MAKHSRGPSGQLHAFLQTYKLHLISLSSALVVSSLIIGANLSVEHADSQSVSSYKSDTILTPLAAKNLTYLNPGKQDTATLAKTSGGKITPEGAGGAMVEDLEASYLTTAISGTTQGFIDQIAPYVHKVAESHGLYGSLIVAQAILESESGQSGLTLRSNNLFGIKGSYQGQSVTMETGEYDDKGKYYTVKAPFRKYPTIQASIDDYVNLMVGGLNGNDDFYAGTWKKNAANVVEAAKSLTGKYATSPAYAQSLINLIKNYNLVEVVDKSTISADILDVDLISKPDDGGDYVKNPDELVSDSSSQAPQSEASSSSSSEPTPPSTDKPEEDKPDTSTTTPEPSLVIKKASQVDKMVTLKSDVAAYCVVEETTQVNQLLAADKTAYHASFQVTLSNGAKYYLVDGSQGLLWLPQASIKVQSSDDSKTAPLEDVSSLVVPDFGE